MAAVQRSTSAYKGHAQPGALVFVVLRCLVQLDLREVVEGGMHLPEPRPRVPKHVLCRLNARADGVPCLVSTLSLFAPQAQVFFVGKRFKTFQQLRGQTSADRRFQS